MLSGVSRSSSTVAAPTRSGKSNRPPNPKVNASGGVPMQMSFAARCTIDFGKQSQIAITSRWKCIVALGLPVEPEVKAMSAVSLAAVSTALKGVSQAVIRASSPSADGWLQYTICCNTGQRCCAASSSASSRLSQIATATCAFSITSTNSFSRNRGMVATATSPALMIANQQTAIIALFALRNSTRLPGTSPISLVNTCATWSTCACICA